MSYRFAKKCFTQLFHFWSIFNVFYYFLHGTSVSMFIDKSYNKVIIYQFKDNIVYTSLFMQQLNCIERKILRVKCNSLDPDCFSRIGAGSATLLLRFYCETMLLFRCRRFLKQLRMQNHSQASGKLYAHFKQGKPQKITVFFSGPATKSRGEGGGQGLATKKRDRVLKL